MEMSFAEFLYNSFGPAAGMVAAGFVAILVVLIVLPKAATKKVDPLDRLKGDKAAEAVGDFHIDDGTDVMISRHKKRTSHLQKFAHLLESKDSENTTMMRKKLIQAGFRDRDALSTLVAAQVLLGLGLLIVGLFYAFIINQGPMTMQKAFLSIAMPAIVGFYGPKFWLNKKALARQESILVSFPDSLDLLLICIEAGQSLDQGIQRVAREIASSAPELGEELELVAQEMKAGKQKSVVLRDFADRVDLKDIHSFVTILIQAQSFGTSVSEALRVYAAEMRDKRIMRAEEKANVLPTKMTLGTMAFCVPALLIILVGPAVVDVMKNLSGGGLF